MKTKLEQILKQKFYSIVFFHYFRKLEFMIFLNSKKLVSG